MIRMFLAASAAVVLASCGADTSSQTAAPPSALGQAVQLGSAEVTIEAVEKRDQVGGQYFEEKASDGGTLILVRYAVKNTGDKPLPSYSMPRVQLVDAAGVKYDPDIGKSAAAATQLDLDAKAMSDLNPGIRTRNAEVFEVAADRYDPATWAVLVDGKTRVALQ